MKLTLQKDIPALSGKSREERAAIICPLSESDSKLKFHRKLLLGILIFAPAFTTLFHHAFGNLAAAFFTGALLAVVVSTFLQLFYFNPRLKEILADKNT